MNSMLPMQHFNQLSYKAIDVGAGQLWVTRQAEVSFWNGLLAFVKLFMSLLVA